MKFAQPLQEAKFQKREKRFFAHCLLEKKEVIAHCPNPGSMRGNLEKDSDAWLLDFGPNHLQQGKKLRYKWVAVESCGVRVVIDTMLANTLVAEGLADKKIVELSAYPTFEKEKVLIAGSRFDFFLPGNGSSLPEVALEVKSVSMGEGGEGKFPDSVTTRGQKHLRELIECKERGMRSILLFLHMRENGRTVKPAIEIDPDYAYWLEKAAKAGVEILVYGIDFFENEIRFGKRQEFRWK